MRAGATFLLAGAAGGVMALAACGSSPPDRFYTLGGDEAPRAGPVQSGAPGDRPAAPAWVIAVGPVTIPEMVDRPQIVVATGPQRIDVLEERRWAQPLGRDIGELVAAAIEHSVPQSRAYVDSGGTPPPAAHTARLTLHIDRFDSWLGPQPRVEDDVRWSMRCAAGDLPDRSGAAAPGGFAQLREPVAPAGDPYAALAAAHARALTRLGEPIAAAVAQLGDACRTPAAGASR